MYHSRLNYNLNQTPLENLVALFNSRIKPGIPDLKVEEVVILETVRLDGTNVAEVTLGESIDSNVVDSVKVHVVQPDMDVLLNDLGSVMILEYTTWSHSEAEDFKKSLQYASSIQGWDLSKQIDIKDVALGKDSSGGSIVIITQANPFYKPQYVFNLPIRIYDVNVTLTSAVIKESENL